MEALAHGYRAKYGFKVNVAGIGLNPNTLVVIKLPDPQVLRIVSRSLFLALVLLALPSIGSIVRVCCNTSSYEPKIGPVNPDDFKIFPVVSRDLVDEGLIKTGQKGFIVGAGKSDLKDDLDSLKGIGIDLVMEYDVTEKNQIQNEMFDFVFVPNFRLSKLVDPVVKNGGIVITPLGNNPLSDLKQLTSYRVVYLRRFDKTLVGMRKSGELSGIVNPKKQHVLCGITPEEKKAALKELEDVYLEPPRRALANSKAMSRKIKFLPDLLKDTLENYERRVIISDDTKALDWFYKNYPMKDQAFETCSMEIDKNENEENMAQEAGMSTWWTKNVKREDYVVMKAEARIVEEMMKDKTICLVDELFLECKNEWQDGDQENGSKRAYWQCLALYGKLRDEGIPVHQWWN